MYAFTLLLLTGLKLNAQISTNQSKLLQYAKAQKTLEKVRKQKAVVYASIKGYTFRKDSTGITIELQFIDNNGFPQYYTTENANAAKTISTDKVYSGGGAGLSLDGSGITVHEWDAGSVRSTHQEFGSRVHNNDATGIHYTQPM